MKKLPVLLALAAGLALAACDNSVQPTKAPADQNPQVDKNRPFSSSCDVARMMERRRPARHTADAMIADGLGRK